MPTSTQLQQNKDKFNVRSTAKKPRQSAKPSDRSQCSVPLLWIGCGLEVDHQFELGRLLDGQVGGLCSL